MSTTNYLGLNIPDKNSKGRVVTEVFDPNFTKLDQNAEVVDRDKNAIWGGLDGGGLIEDPSVTKVVGKRYIGADGKAYICLKPSNINNSDNYMPCNVVDNLNKLQNLLYYNRQVVWVNNGSITYTIRGNTVSLTMNNVDVSSSGKSFAHPVWFADAIKDTDIAKDSLYSFVVANFGTCAEVFLSKTDIKVYCSGASIPSASGSCSFVI